MVCPERPLSWVRIRGMGGKTPRLLQVEDECPDFVVGYIGQGQAARLSTRGIAGSSSRSALTIAIALGLLPSVAAQSW